MAEFETLYTLAEIAVALAGFAAVVVLFKRSGTGKWAAADADRFNGMLVHAMAAGFFCLLPPFVSVLTSDPASIWTIGSIALGVQVAAHAWKISSLPTSTLVARVLLVVPLGIVVLQVLNVSGFVYASEFRPYLAGVLWHILQSGLLFALLVYVPVSDTYAVET